MPNAPVAASATALPAISRRRALGGTVAALFAALPGAATDAAITANTAILDGELLALGRKLEAAWAHEKTVFEAEEDQYSHESDERCDRANEATSRVVEEIEACKALTLDGLAVKALAISWCHCGEPIADDDFNDQGTTNVRLAASIVRDLLSVRGSA